MRLSDLPASPTRLTLYSARYCGYCLDVQAALKRLPLSVETRDICQDRLAAAELKEATDRTRVPVLRIEDQNREVIWLPESPDIIAYLASLAPDTEAPRAASALRWLQPLAWALLIGSFFAPSEMKGPLLLGGVLLIGLRYYLRLRAASGA